MAGELTGWYPDPGGEPGRYRYWDGSRWSAQTTDDPRRPPPRPGSSPPPPRRRLGLIIGILALLVIGLVVGALVIGTLRPSDPGQLPSTSVSGGDDRSPTPSPSAPSGSPTGQGPCVSGQPNARAPHPTDGRVYGGNLSFPINATFQPAAPEPRFSFAYDVTQQVKVVNDEPGWIAQLAVGQLRGSDGFRRDARQTAQDLVACTINGGIYSPYQPTRRDLRNGALTIDGRKGWLVETEITVDSPGLPFAGDHAIFVVVPDGDDWGMFFGAAPIGNQALIETLQQTVAALRTY